MRALLRVAVYLGAGIAGTALGLILSSKPAAADDGPGGGLVDAVTEVVTPPPPETPPPSPPPTPDTPAPVPAPVEPLLPVLAEVVDGVTDPLGELTNPTPPASPQTGDDAPSPAPAPAPPVDTPDTPATDQPAHNPFETLIEHLTAPADTDDTRTDHGESTLRRLLAPVIADKQAPTSSPGQDVNRGPATSNAPTGESGCPAPPLIAGPAGRLDASPVFSPGAVPPHGVCVPAGRYPSPPRPPA